MSNHLDQFLDFGGRFVIKKECEKVLLVFEAEINNEKYHMGISLPNEIKTALNGDCSKAALRAIKRVKESLKGERNGCTNLQNSNM